MSTPEGPARPDPFGTAERRAAILSAWRSSPTRFREDANAEEDLALGGYADRLLVELAQNAADAAARAGVPGRLCLRVLSTADGPVLSAANTGEPLDAAGVDSLTSLRASAKRDAPQAAGRFGVGFAAVLGVTDAPALRSTTGGVRFSAANTRDEIAADGHLTAEAARRDGRVPVLRLPWPDPAAPPDGYDAEVRLPLRDAVAVDAVRDALAAFDPALLLGLPSLSTVDIDGRSILRLDDGDDVLLDGTRWRVRAAAGEIPAKLLVDRPVEERERPQWTMLAAVPVKDGVPQPLREPQTLHAPTPTREPLAAPLRLIGTFPLDPQRAHVPPGALTDWLTDRAVDTVTDLLRDLADTPAVLDLLPPPHLSGRLAATLRERLLDRLRHSNFLPAAAGGDFLPTAGDDGRVVPTAAVAVPDGLVEPLTEVLDGLLPAGWWSAGRAGVLAALGIRLLGVPEVVDALAGLERDAEWWHRMYAALAALPLDPADREALAALPVPLADGRTVTGPARVLLPAEEMPPGLSVLGLLVADRRAVHPLLERLGARPATPAGVLHDERVRAAVATSLDAEDPEPIAHAVLGLVAAAPQRAVWLADLALPAEDGDWYPAGDLLLPGSPMPDLIVPDSPFGVVDPELVEEYGADTLVAVGVLERFAVLDESEVDIVDADELELDDADGWLAAVVDPEPGTRIARVRAVRDLEWVRSDRWDAALALLTAPPLRAVLAGDCELITPDDTTVTVPGYTRWWLSRHPVLGGRRPAECRIDTDNELVGLFDPAPGDPELAALLGAYRGFGDLLDAATADPAVATDLLARVADPARTVVPELLAVLYPRLAATLAGYEFPPPPAVRVAPDLVVPAERVVVLDQPWLLGRLGDRYAVPGGATPAAVADFLDLPLLSEH